MSELEVPLSEPGHRRRELILAAAIRQARLRRQRRRTIALTGATATIVIMAAVGAYVLNQPSPLVVQVTSQPAPAPRFVAVAPSPAVIIEYIQTDPAISDRLAMLPKQTHWKPLNDRELLQVLADAGRPSGLIELDGRAVLLPRRTVHQ